jgi:5-methyltetrahydrofolate--homocysteine methyltransferase
MAILCSSLRAAIESGDRQTATRLIREALAEAHPPQPILDAMVEAMDLVGQRFQRHEIFVPEMLIAARAMKEALALLEPTLAKAGHQPICTAVIGTVEGDLHDIGKNLVAMMWRGANMTVIDLGAGVAPQKFVDAAHQHGPRIVGLSALLTTTMPAMQRTVELLRSAGPQGMTILVGGAPVTQRFADQIGADGYAPDAASAVEVARGLLVKA